MRANTVNNCTYWFIESFASKVMTSQIKHILTVYHGKGRV